MIKPNSGHSAIQPVPRGWCPEGGAQRVVPRGWCPEGGAQRVVPRGGCPEGGAQRVVPRGWCPEGGAQRVVPRGWQVLPTGELGNWCSARGGSSHRLQANDCRRSTSKRSHETDRIKRAASPFAWQTSVV